jgi:hypothetical protein
LNTSKKTLLKPLPPLWIMMVLLMHGVITNL